VKVWKGDLKMNLERFVAAQKDSYEKTLRLLEEEL